MERLKFWLAAGMLFLTIGLAALFGFASELGIEPAALGAWLLMYLVPAILVPKALPVIIGIFVYRRLRAYFRKSSKSAD